MSKFFPKGYRPGGAEVVREFRHKLGWTQVEAARWFGVHKRTWGKWERGERGVPLPLYRAMAGQLQPGRLALKSAVR
jgi:DNA-binding XRE family transcriptional regulator